jgi:dGTP triphosphohydrolase
VGELFGANYKATGLADRDLQRILPESDLYLLDDSPDEAARARAVANLISSMTERQLLMTHKRLAGIEPGSITDLT